MTVGRDDGKDGMRRIHIALSVADVDAAVQDYTARFEQAPDSYVPGRIAVFRCPGFNMSVRKVDDVPPGGLRHLGWETEHAAEFTEETDINGIIWETFSPEAQLGEVEKAWPGEALRPARDGQAVAPQKE